MLAHGYNRWHLCFLIVTSLHLLSDLHTTYGTPPAHEICWYPRLGALEAVFPFSVEPPLTTLTLYTAIRSSLPSMLPVSFFSYWLSSPVSTLSHNLHSHSRIQRLSLCTLNASEPCSGILCLFPARLLCPQHAILLPRPPAHRGSGLFLGIGSLVDPLSCSPVASSWSASYCSDSVCCPYSSLSICLFRSLRLLSDLLSFHLVTLCTDRLVSNTFYSPLPLPAQPPLPHPLLPCSTMASTMLSSASCVGFLTALACSWGQSSWMDIRLHPLATCCHTSCTVFLTLSTTLSHPR